MQGLLRSLWREPRPPGVPARVWRDWLLVGVLVPAAVLEGVLRPDLPWGAASVVLTAAVMPTLLWRRTRPLAMLVIALGAAHVAPLLIIGSTPDNNALAFVVVLVYALFRWGSGREAMLGVPVMFGSMGLAFAFGRIPPSDVVGGLIVLSSAAALGFAFRYRAGARLRELDRVKLLEREQLARDLHDTVAHHVSAMAIRAQAGLATSATRPEAADEALRVIEAEAARTLTEMRAMVRLLRRNEPVELTPGRRIADIEQLAGRGRVGPSVKVTIEGDVEAVPPSVGAAIYRIAQESITNARRHARHATRIDVHVAADDTSVRLHVSDDGDAGSARSHVTPGYGLLGMIERAGLLGGTCEAGPNPGRGWTVTAVLPRAGAAT
ncbi:signal transduction histidine kinase [Thermocatellispora tengchongensis]|uniref:histidine kinase n=1 Tax=Thermocatellispora tengchongensis TaxID=1073253 RepID=A0A840PEZ8_9ACTN|nr:sensor histidine kinase [Thermocatellispora tengchongensis]MBB5135727.1 signal transduction histidine kinase [Thermocatellispora tengchongensis]